MHFHVQMWVAVALVGHLRPAEHDQGIVAADIRPGFGVAVEIDIADPVPAVSQHRVQRAERLRRHMLKTMTLAISSLARTCPSPRTTHL